MSQSEKLNRWAEFSEEILTSERNGDPNNRYEPGYTEDQEALTKPDKE